MARDGGELRELASSWGVQTAHRDGFGRGRRADPDVLVAVLRALGAPIDRPSDAAGALRAKRLDDWRTTLEPVVVCRAGAAPHLDVRVRAGSRVPVPPGARAELVEAVDVDGERYERHRVRTTQRLEAGYHELRLDDGSTTVVVAAPARAPDPGGRLWGAFMPLYALRSPGIASLRDLRTLDEWVASLGGDFVGTLPLYAQFLDGPVADPSPYSPASRLHWNELYADVPRSVDATRDPRVDYVREYARVRASLQRGAASWTGEASGEVDEYARFRGAMRRFGAPWTEWPEAARSGRLRDDEIDPEERRFHAYAQTVVGEQLRGLDRLYLDFPVGVHAAGYDTWRHRDAFALDAHAGAPPDQLFAGGQDWGFPPMHPVGSRRTGHAYLVAALRTAFGHAIALRLDHVMGLHRMYWVPEGASPEDGIYVRYPWRELYAVLLVEAARAGAMVVGEDLGTVPKAVRDAMDSRGLFRMHVAQFEDQPPASERVFASLGTHDTPMHAAASDRDVTDALTELASSPARAVVVALEDLWGEAEPQNVPGTSGDENWTRRSRVTIDELVRDDDAASTLRAVTRARGAQARPAARDASSGT